MRTLRFCLPFLALLILVPDTLLAQGGISSNKEEKNRNVMLNASSDNQPRQISIGLPNKNATDVFEDGLPVSYAPWPMQSHLTWRSSNANTGSTLLSISESALQTGTIGYAVSSSNKKAGDHFEGNLGYSANHFGKQVIDLFLATPLGKGWGLTASTYQTFDYGSNRLDVQPLQERLQIYRGGLNKAFANGKGSMNLLYQYAQVMTYYDKNGLFYYNGKDGSTDKYQDFDLGKSQYLADYDHLEYLDVVSGQMKRENIKDLATNKIHQLHFGLNYHLSETTLLEFNSRVKIGDKGSLFFPNVGMFQVKENDGYTYRDGTPFSGTVQSRYMYAQKGFENSWMNTLQLTGSSANLQHSWRLALNERYSRAGIEVSSTLYAQEAKKDPKVLFLSGKMGRNYNASSEYFNGHDNKLSLVASDDWHPLDNLYLTAGARLEWQSTGGNGFFAYDYDNTLIESRNIRVENFTLSQGVKNRWKGSWLNPTATLSGRWMLWGGLGVTGEYVFLQQHTTMEDYAGLYKPYDGAVTVHMLRGGLFFNSPILEMTSQVFSISQTNYKSRERFTNPDDQSETVVIPILYDVATRGWTTDILLKPFEGFQFHGLLTLQDPQYKDFKFQPIYKTGPGPEYDFSNNSVTAMSKVLVELDPSYSFDKWRIWLSFRYQGKQYINRTNTLYFKGRWETFGGVDYKLNDKVNLSLNLVNLLNQKGASGSIISADLATDVRDYQHHYLMSGSYIRPFTMELSANIRF